MNHALQVLNFTQQSIEKILEEYSLGQINQIPTGFKNNLIWNYAHIISAVQLLCYGRAGLQPRLDEGFINQFKIGTKPEAIVSFDEYNQYKQFAIDGINNLQQDIDANKFATFNGYKTMSGIEINNIDLAIDYANMHSGLHLGYILAMKKFIK